MAHKHLRILILDKRISFQESMGFILEHLKRSWISVELSWEFQMLHGSPDEKKISEELYLEIEAATSLDDFDLIVVGNNLGNGLYRVEAITEKALEKTVVVWHVYGDGDEEIYRYKFPGLKMFSSRSDLGKLIVAKFSG